MMRCQHLRIPQHLPNCVRRHPSAAARRPFRAEGGELFFRFPEEGESREMAFGSPCENVSTY